MESEEVETARRIADTIHAGFVDYVAGFNLISRRARSHFERREWPLQEANAGERLLLHNERVLETVAVVKALLGDMPDRRGEWRLARGHFKRRIAERADMVLAETYFNSVTRRVFTTIGVDNDVELRWFGATSVPRGEATAEMFTSVTRTRDSAAMITSILDSYQFEAPWVDLEGDARRVAARLDSFLLESWDGLEVDGVDMLRPVFFRNKGAYLIGRLRQLNRIAPIVLPIIHGEDGLRVDSLLLTELQVSRLFSFTRSYFFVEWPNPAELVGFLKSLLPMKSLAELHTAIGFPQHGKTSLYRSLYRHLENSNDKFVLARGTPGMVMSVFTLVSFNVVFKIIKDHFDPPKNTTRDAVMRRYRLVYNHDRVGRMVDAQEFENLSFDRDRFDPALLEQLLGEAGGSVHVKGDQVVIRHVYTERQVYPLNLYLREMSPDKAEAVALDWGAAIKDLAVANVFPGDLFTKNFGVTRHGSVVFYDYDELSLLEECRFRVIPESDDHELEMSSQVWFAVEPGDVFPEQFPTFMRFPRDVPDSIWERFCEVHGDLFTVDYWTGVQEQLALGDLPDFYPYPQRLRFRRRSAEAAE
ncbi:MAG: bifunctional isocitrate dehydrogenase kinase/phosphatase [Acidimicrobiaceae bacterium]|nr:bifunctional isocitrate dehydrogenase kinase/phosphatase [Acidimicrobiaceae bacterium]MDP6481972.1 bifunctional isocitrate dehydrogenase kinase/phosphatase [Acidimicrobiales bacterium]MDP6697721.1 bifunctional isocitrate dehydrogenase kinase/phosphatase [Acidimicrobiales bacterium]